MFKATRMRLALLIGGVMALVVPALAGASTYDMTPATDSISAQVSSELPTALAVGGGILALFIGWRVIKRVTK